MSKFGSLVAISVVALSVTACGTTSGAMKTSASNPAPVSFKGGQVNSALASKAAARPTLKPYISADAMDYAVPAQPRVTAMPQQTSRLNTAPAPSLSIQPERFDQSGVDTDLYMHQRVGRPYTIKGKRYTPKHNPSYDEKGIASWYGPNFHGKLTANGETYDKNGLTAAHKTLPLNSNVFVTNLENGKTIMLRVNDRGPFVAGRIIDLSAGAAKALGVSGLSDVRVQYAGPADPGAGKGTTQAEVLPAPAPKAPVVETPQVQAPVAEMPPVAQAPVYKPLSVVPFGLKEQVSLPSPALSAPLAPQMSIPQMNLPAIPGVPDIAPESTRMAPLVPQTQMPSGGRQTFTPPQDGGVMTLTIKGPIHMASATGDVKAEFIPAFYEGASPELTASHGVHYVQAVTFSNMSRVDSVRPTLQAAGNVSVHDIKRGPQTLHRVMVGPYVDEAVATNALSLVATLGYTDARIVEMH